MATDPRFTILFDEEQRLFVPDSPVWVSRCRLSLDSVRKKRFLQVRMVNRSKKQIYRVFLRVDCFDAAGLRTDRLQLVPMRVSAGPGRVFGDGLAVELPRIGGACLEVFAQRVCFADGTAWDEDSRRTPLAFAPPVPVRAEDEAYARLRRDAGAEKMPNDYYYSRRPGLWTCVCGMPNSDRDLACAHCGAQRAWLERNLAPAGSVRETGADASAFPPSAASSIPGRDGVFSGLTAAPIPQSSVPPAPAFRPAAPAAAPAQNGAAPAFPARDAGTLAPAEQVLSPKTRRVPVLALAAAALVLLGAFFSYRFLMPWLRYRKAVRAEQAGETAAAEELFTALGGYKDSPARLERLSANGAVALMGEGQYAEALALLDGVPGYEAYVADCLYSLGVLACNEGDADRAEAYAVRLQERFPDYEKLPELLGFCLYSRGSRMAERAAEATDSREKLRLYQTAAELFREADCADSADCMTECLYRAACLRAMSSDLLQAAQEFGQLGDYRDAAARRLDCMQSYVRANLTNDPDPSVLQFLPELYEAGVQMLTVSALRQSIIDHRDTITDLSAASLYYRFDLNPKIEKTLKVAIAYELPDGQTNVIGILNPDYSCSGARTWAEIAGEEGEIPSCAVSGEVVLSGYYMSPEDAAILPAFTCSFRYLAPDGQTIQPSSPAPAAVYGG